MFRKSALAAATALCTFSTILAGTALAKDWKKVTVGVEGAFPPFNSTSASGELQGPGSRCH